MMIAKHILIADDEPKVAFFLGQSLERSNRDYRVTVVNSGEEALRELTRSKVDLLVTDLRMPGISGLELIRQVRTSSPHTRSILITAYGDDAVEAEARRLGASRYIAKPFDIELFITAVQESLAPSREERAMSDEQRLRDKAVSLVFHKLRIPLTFILSHASMLAEQVEGPHREMAQAILRHALEMREAVDDFTLLAEWSIGQMPGYLQTINLHHALETTAAQLSALALEREQTIEVAPATSPAHIAADAFLLGILLTALVSSAIKCTPRSGRLLLSAEQQSQRAVVTVEQSCDTGPDVDGVPDERWLCLTVAHCLVRAMDGELEIGPGKDGTVFRLTLPGRYD